MLETFSTLVIEIKRLHLIYSFILEMASQEDGSSVDESVKTSDSVDVPREVVLKRSSKGFGFNIRGQVSEGGKLRSIGGELYAPLQYISAVVEGGPAAEIGIKAGDRLIEVNGITVEGSDHQKVVELIKSSGNSVRLTILSVTAEEALRLEADSHSQTPENFDLKSVPVQIQSFEKKTGQDGKEYIVYPISICNEVVCSRRYREFYSVDGNLKRQFVDFVFPVLPGKWPFKLSDVALDGRRRKLQEYMEKVCSVKMIFESDLMQDFLGVKDQKRVVVAPPSPEGVASKPLPREQSIQLPSGSSAQVDLPVHSRVSEVYRTAAARLGLSHEALDHFTLYSEEDNFYFKMAESEFPAKFVENSGKKIFLRKWVFSPAIERGLFANECALGLLYDQAVADIEEGILSVPEEVQEKMGSFKDNPQKFLRGLAKLESYNTVTFPHCPCDARKNGHIVVSMNMAAIRLRACNEEGVLEEQEQVFSWDKVKTMDGDEEGEVFMLEYLREGKPSKWIKVNTPYFKYMSECAKKIQSQLS